MTLGVLIIFSIIMVLALKHDFLFTAFIFGFVVLSIGTDIVNTNSPNAVQEEVFND